MSVKNFDRDLTFVTVGQALLATPASTFAADPPGSSLLGVRTAHANIDRQLGVDVTIQAARRVVSMVHMLPPPVGKRTVYRVKGFVYFDHDDALCELLLGIGDAAPTGTNDVLAKPVPLKLNRRILNFDETIALDNFGTIDATDYSDRPVAFGVSTFNESGANIDAAWRWHLSVQKLDVKTPTYESMVR